MRHVQIFFLILCALSVTVHAQEVWESLKGPTPTQLLGTVEEFILVGEDTVLALANGFAVSFDQGQTWKRRTVGLTPEKTWAMAIDSGRTIMVISLEDGVFRSTDLGEHWQMVNEGITQPVRIHGGYELWDICYNDMEKSWYIASIDGLVVKSTDNGDSWNAIFVDSLKQRFSSITAAHNGNVVVCGHEGVYTWMHDQAVWWRTADEGLDLQRAGSRLYATISWGGYLVSDDHGESWQEESGVEGLVRSRIFDLGEHGLILGGSTMLQYGQTYQSPDSGRSWNLIDGLSEYANELHSIVRLPSGSLLAGMGRGMLRSDGTLTKWYDVNDGWQFANLFDAVLTSTKRIVVAGREGVHFLEDGHINWVDAIDGGYVTELLQHTGGTLLADTWPGLLRSTDQGNTWDSLILGYNQLSFLIEDDRGILYGGLVDSLVHRSDDSGATWHAGDARIPQAEVHGAVSHSGFLYILTKKGGLFRIDSALTTVEHLLSVSVSGTPAALSKDGAGTLVVSGSNGNFLSRDLGGTWERMSDPEPRTCLPAHTAMDSRGTFYCLFQMYDGPIDYSIWPENLIYKTTDDGATWTGVPLPQPYQQYTLLRLLRDGKLYLASTSEGLFRTRDVVTTVDQATPAVLSDNEHITVWPQPARERLSLSWEKETEIHTIVIHDCIGRVVLRQCLQPDRPVRSMFVDITGFKTGMYVVSLVGGTQVFRKNVLVRENR